MARTASSCAAAVAAISAGMASSAACRSSTSCDDRPRARASSSPSCISSAIAAVLACVGQPLRSAWMRRATSDQVISAEPGVFDRASVRAPRARAISIASTVRVVVPLELSVTSSVSGPTVRAP